MNYKNNEGYPDPTAGKAVQEADKPPRHVLEIINALKCIASLAGFEITGRIWLKDKESGGGGSGGKMTAKEYLKKIKRLDRDIDRKQYEFDSLKKHRTYISGMDYSADRVQTSPSGEGFTILSDRLYDLQKEINSEIDRYHDMRHKAINEIQSLSKEEYADILFRVYVQYQTLTEAAHSMGYDYYWACHLHGKALLEFDDKFLKHRN